MPHLTIDSTILEFDGVAFASCSDWNGNSRHWAQRDGHRITFIDPLDAGEGCSFGNAGSLSPSAVLPVGMPGMWRKVPKWLLDPSGPLVIRAHYLPTVLPWLMRFLRHSSEKEVTRIATAIRGLLGQACDPWQEKLDIRRIRAWWQSHGHCIYTD